MNTDPIILRSLSKDKEEVKCTFERPHVFLNDPSDPVRNKYKKYKILDIADSRPSQIIIRGELSIIQIKSCNLLVYSCVFSQNTPT